jgi:hypothetical protein
MIGVFAILFLAAGACAYWVLDIWTWKSSKKEGKRPHGKK